MSDYLDPGCIPARLGVSNSFLSDMRDHFDVPEECILSELDAIGGPQSPNELTLACLCRQAVVTLYIYDCFRIRAEEELTVIEDITGYIKLNAVALAQAAGLPRGLCWTRGIWEHVEAFGADGLVETMSRCLEGLLEHRYPEMYASRGVRDLKGNPMGWLKANLVDVDYPLLYRIWKAFDVAGVPSAPSISKLHELSAELQVCTRHNTDKKRAAFNVYYNRLVLWAVALTMYTDIVVQRVASARMSRISKRMLRLFNKIQNRLTNSPMSWEEDILFRDIKNGLHNFLDGDKRPKFYFQMLIGALLRLIEILHSRETGTAV
ncbi:BRRF1 [Phascolarctid gammaherpesvirus 1]|uniref:BRRF1 n=1 Tax=Phascolarctid gammaherpesvirus 1 TaxID=2249313 RepID=A0A3Q8J4F6_9GAMA|nr:BRRF1 [Phascolarctid gammaherpesvirus 1]AZB49220.1 BRRF1 [Phascolarctid gammaherpesvirus 1]